MLPKEVSPGWTLEAIKAQAVTARTYALYNLNKHKADGYDICDTVHCQVYGGQGAEDWRTTKAVDDTRGLVLTYNNIIIRAVYHASSGGHTESAENVWNVSAPYLRGISDVEDASPYQCWEKKLLVKTFENTLKQLGYNVGLIKKLNLSLLSLGGAQPADRSLSGRVQKLSIIGTKDRVEIAGNKIRAMLGLPSTLFNIKTSGPYIIISGSGAGHGVGMSQWGAKTMAERASPEDANFYQTILKHYYQGIEVQKFY